MENQENTTKAPLMHDLQTSSPSLLTKKVAGIVALMVVLGLATGFFLGKMRPSTSTSTMNGQVINKSSIHAGSVYGSESDKDYDMSEVPQGTLKLGGIQGEGEYHLEREGGAARNVYLTSSSVDLSQFVGRKVKVWGQTQKGQEAGWLMEVGRLEVLE